MTQSTEVVEVAPAAELREGLKRCRSWSATTPRRRTSGRSTAEQPRTGEGRRPHPHCVTPSAWLYWSICGWMDCTASSIAFCAVAFLRIAFSMPTSAA